MRIARVTLVAITAALLACSALMFNLRYMARTIGFDEAYYYSWVDNWEENPIYYPHHLLFGPVSVGFQRSFVAVTGVENTAFIQRFKNSLAYSVGIALFFVAFVADSRRYAASLLAALLVGVSGALWSDSMHHETATIPAILVGIAITVLFFYKRARRPLPVVILYSVMLGVAILLHQMYLLAVVVGTITFLTTRTAAERRLRFGRNLIRTAVHLCVTLGIVAGAYFYVGLSVLDLRLHDNPDGRQTYMGVAINGNFLRYFYLLNAYGIWGEPQGDMLVQALDGYGSAFVPHFWPLHVHQDAEDPEHSYPSNLTFWLLVGLAGVILVGAGPALRRYGGLIPGLVTWIVAAALFIAWWEPQQMEHWIYVSVITWLLAFTALFAVITVPRSRWIRAGIAGTTSLVMATVWPALFSLNMETVILPQQEFSRPMNIPASVWKDEYSMAPVLKEQ